MAYDNEVAESMMEETGEIEAIDGETEMIANVADELSQLSGTTVSPEEVSELIDMIASGESGETEPDGDEVIE